VSSDVDGHEREGLFGNAWNFFTWTFRGGGGG